MKALIFMLSFTIIGCGSTKSEETPGFSCSTLAGHYTNTIAPSQTLDISNACTFTDSVCGYNANYSIPINGQTTVTVIGTNGTPGCMSSTAHQCEFQTSSPYLVIDCGAPNQWVFTRQ